MIPSISKSEAVTIFKNSDLSKNSESLLNIKNCLSCIKDE